MPELGTYGSKGARGGNSPKLPKRKMLITGGAGGICSVIINKLYEAGERNITVLDSMTEQIHGKHWKESYL